ncbi:MAG: glycosyltransferase family 39 protein, partial [Anaerolineae bacterium]
MPPPARNYRSQGARLVLLAVLLVAFALRVFRLGYQELRGDEAFGYFFSQKPVAEIVRSTISLREPHPVAGYVVEKGWLALAGHSEFALRFASAWFAVLAVALLYRLGRRLALGRPTALLAAALLAVSPYAIWHSQDSRMYSMSLALTLASTCLAVETLEGRGVMAAVGYVLVSWLALHTHYFAAFVLLAQNIFVVVLALVDSRYRRRLVPWFALQVVLGLLYLPWLLAAARTLQTYGGAADSPGLTSAMTRALSVFAAGETVPAGWRTAMAVLAGILLGIGAIRLALS